MRQIKPRPILDYFRGASDDDSVINLDLKFNWDKFFYRHRNRFNRQSIVIVTWLAFGIAAFFGRTGKVLFLTDTICLIALAFQVRQLAHGIYLTRKLPAAGYDQMPMTVEYEIRNATELQCDELIVRDFFTGTLEPVVQTVRAEPIPGLRLVRAHRKVNCDAGMGEHKWGPLSTTVTDWLGLFEVVVTENQMAPFHVLPSPISLPNFNLPDSIDSNRLGLNESRLRGHSSNFFGVREYVQGDPIKSINWKLSAKHRQLIVNEFENQVPTDLTVCVDLDAQNHIGRAGESTWKTAKDIAVAIFQNHASRASRFQFLSQALNIPLGSGVSHQMSITHAVSKLLPVKGAESRTLLEILADKVPSGSSLVFITPVYQNDRRRFVRALEHLLERSVQVSVVLIEARSYLVDIPPQLASAIMQVDRYADSTVAKMAAELSGAGIPAYSLSRGDSLAHAFLSREIQ